jgi:hypothetical protein
MSELKQSLDYNGVYPCPVCRHGEVRALTLMEAFACNFCQHIFTANTEQQLLSMADSQLPLTWRWQGNGWKGIRQESLQFVWGYGVAGTVFVLLPTVIITTAAYLFPPLPKSPLAWLSAAWIFGTFFAHLGCLIWLLLEYYQVPVGAYLVALGRRIGRSLPER